MHEITIAQSVIELAEEIAISEQAESISDVEIEIGALSGVVPDALRFALDVAVKNTKLEEADIRFLIKSGKALCRECGHEFETDELLVFCPECKRANFKITGGKQLRINSITL